MQVTTAMVKELRERTQAGMMDCKNALVESGGDIDKAVELLREKGLAASNKKSGRIAAEGRVDSYIHMGGKIGVLVEVNCETDFVAKTDTFQTLCHDISLQIAASNPLFVSKEDVPEENIEKEREILRVQALNEGKPEKIVERMVEGRIEKYYKEVCLLEQPFVKNPDITVNDLVNEATLASGEKISVRRFTRYECGEGLERKVSDLQAEIDEMTKKA
ncbi:MAG TPA: translation elongation factor Ts [Christensenellaceae bacterium]|jgi:elongation factor Ts|nr:translation elongation factor Ts [Christensenellaceae bacterium]